MIRRALPKVEVASMEMSCHFETVETLTAMTPSPELWLLLLLLSLFWTSMPPGLSSHLISPMFLASLSPLLPLLGSLELVLENLFDLNFIIFDLFGKWRRSKEKVMRLGAYIIEGKCWKWRKKSMNKIEAALVLQKSKSWGNTWGDIGQYGQIVFSRAHGGVSGCLPTNSFNCLIGGAKSITFFYFILFFLLPLHLLPSKPINLP